MKFRCFADAGTLLIEFRDVPVAETRAGAQPLLRMPRRTPDEVTPWADPGPRACFRSFDRIAPTFQAGGHRLRIVLLAGRLGLCGLLILRARLLPVRTALG